MDIQKLIAQAVKVLTENEDMIRAFNKNPGKTLEKILGMDLPELLEVVGPLQDVQP